MTTQKLVYNQPIGLIWADALADAGNKLVPALLMTFETWYQRGKQRQQLRELTVEQLEDIGISREQADAEANKAFWQD